jgi:riboflavin kinase / FMN adenylyltransferase
MAWRASAAGRRWRKTARCCWRRSSSVSFFGFLRPELKFEGLEPLVAQIARDVEEAKALLSGVRPLSEVDLALGF